MAKYNGTTIAFSHRDRVWKTRYSFTPTCYAYVDNNMLSTNTNNENKVHIWRHESDSALKNRFYNEFTKTSMTVVSNYNPSSVKLFKSISLESDVKNWSVNFSTDKTSPLDPFSQQSPLNANDFSFIDGSVYSDIKPSRVNSVSNTNLAFQIDGDILDNISNQQLSEVTSDNPILEFEVYISSQLGPFQVGETCPILLLDSDGILKKIRGRSVIDSTTYRTFEQGYAVISAYDPVQKIATIKLDFSKSPGNFLDDGSLIQPLLWENLKPYIFVESPPDFNGDYMKGHYLIAEINSNDSAAMELFAININYEPTRLDHSLGQNV